MSRSMLAWLGVMYQPHPSHILRAHTYMPSPFARCPRLCYWDVNFDRAKAIDILVDAYRTGNYGSFTVPEDGRWSFTWSWTFDVDGVAFDYASKKVPPRSTEDRMVFLSCYLHRS
jgi:hypothetical protein